MTVKNAKGKAFYIRRAKIEDAAAIAEIHTLSWQYIYRGLMSDSFLDGLQASERENIWHSVLKNQAIDVLLISIDWKVVGFCSSGACRDSPDTGEIYAIYLHPDQWGKGMGQTLFNTACKALKERGFQSLQLWVATQNNLARHFYERNGMTADGNKKTETIGGNSIEESRYSMRLNRP